MKQKILFPVFLLVFTMVFAGLMLWTSYAEKQAHYTPEYEKVDISSVLEKEYLEEEDYELLFQQAGVTRAGADALISTGQQDVLYALQERFFAEVKLECLRDNLIVQSERLINEETLAEELSGKADKAMSPTFLPVIEAGDILVSFNGHIFGWRSGHAAIVVDGEQGLTVEALTLGSDSEICSVERWREYPCFALLRLKGVSEEMRQKIAAYAEENLVGIPYSLFVFGGSVVDSAAGGGRQEGKGLEKTNEPSGFQKYSDVDFEEQAMVCTEREMEAETLSETSVSAVESEEPLAGTHCAHLVWKAYAQFGYDIDSDGGLIVTPRDIYESDLLEIVQVYGLNPEMCEMR